MLSAKGIQAARRGAIFAGYLKLLPVFIFLVPGLIAHALQAKGLISFDSADQAFPTLVAELLPSGVKGIVIGGLVVRADEFAGIFIQLIRDALYHRLL